MGAADLMERIALAGVSLTLLDREHLAAEPAERLTDELRDLIREHKPELLRLLAANEPAESSAPGTMSGDPRHLPDPWERRIALLIAKLDAAPALRYAMDTDTTSSAEEVSIALAISGKGACEVRIPKSRYDAFDLLEMIERYVSRETAQ